METIQILGKTLTVTVDRPIGSTHPDYSDLVFPVNYGYTEGVIAPDGEEQDAYILGVEEPVSRFTGVVTAVIHRENDVEEKWVVVPQNCRYNQAEIMKAVHFQEQYFSTSIVSVYQKSCGVMPYRKRGEKVEFLLLFQSGSKTWSFPKGHAEAFESELQTASRELKEETGLNAEILNGFREEITYPISPEIQKTVVLFLAECQRDVSIRPGEIEKYIWVQPDEAAQLLKHSRYPEIFQNALNTIHKTM